MLENWPFHVTHRGNHRQTIFRSDDDRRSYLSLLARFGSSFGMSIWAYCLMDNHVHLIAVGRERRSISMALGNTHRACSRIRNEESGVTGQRWAKRFFATTLDEPHLWTAVRYVELNPVRARLVDVATEYRWSSARAHAGLETSDLLAPERPFPGPIDGWSVWLGCGLEEQTSERLRMNTSTGRPTGSDEFIRKLEDRVGRRLRTRTRGPSRREGRS